MKPTLDPIMDSLVYKVAQPSLRTGPHLIQYYTTFYLFYFLLIKYIHLSQKKKKTYIAPEMVTAPKFYP